MNVAVSDPVTTEHLWPDEATGPWLLQLSWVFASGSVHCDRLSIELVAASDDRLTATFVREMPLGSLMAAGRREATLRKRAERGVSTRREVRRYLSLRSSYVSSLTPPRRSGRGREPMYQPSHWEEVAAVYLRGSDHPTVDVAEHFDVPKSTARSWVAKARSLGLIAATSQGRPSGLPEVDLS